MMICSDFDNLQKGIYKVKFIHHTAICYFDLCHRPLVISSKGLVQVAGEWYSGINFESTMTWDTLTNLPYTEIKSFELIDMEVGLI